MSNLSKQEQALDLWRKDIVADGDTTVDEANSTAWNDLPAEVREFYLQRVMSDD